LDDLGKKAAATTLISSIPDSSVLLPAQALAELFHVLVRKLRRKPEEARKAVRFWQDSYPVIATTEGVLTRAFDLAVDHGLATWDAVILGAASLAGCRVLLSEDMHDGFTWGGVTVANPFSITPHPLITELQRAAH
jgi:predicted nucleic acid-binding protein